MGSTKVQMHGISSSPLLLKPVLLVPHSTKNLMSVSQFSSDNNAYFEFFPNHYFVKCQATNIHHFQCKHSVLASSIPLSSIRPKSSLHFVDEKPH